MSQDGIKPGFRNTRLSSPQDHRQCVILVPEECACSVHRTRSASVVSKADGGTGTNGVLQSPPLLT